MKKTMILFVMMMVVTVANAQYDFMFNNVAVSNTTKTNVKATPTRSISVNALAQATARRNGSTTRRATTATATAQTAPQTVQYTETQQEVMNMANAQQKVVLNGTVENVYNNGMELILTVRTPGLYGGEHRYALQGYNSNVEIHRGDRIYFAATYTGTTIPQVYASEFLNYTGMQRYMVETADLYYGGNYGLMLSSNGQMSKWQRTLMNITSTTMTVASLVAIVKSLF
jgi:hypothetical protein